MLDANSYEVESYDKIDDDSISDETCLCAGLMLCYSTICEICFCGCCEDNEWDNILTVNIFHL